MISDRGWLVKPEYISPEMLVSHGKRPRPNFSAFPFFFRSGFSSEVVLFGGTGFSIGFF